MLYTHSLAVAMIRLRPNAL